MNLLLANALGYVVANWKYCLIFVVGIILFFVILFGFKGCGKREVKIDNQAIEKINKANETLRRKQLEELIYENETVIKDVDNRTAIAERSIIEKDRIIKEKIIEIDKKIQESKMQGKDVDSQTLECLLVPDNCD